MNTPAEIRTLVATSVVRDLPDARVESNNDSTSITVGTHLKAKLVATLEAFAYPHDLDVLGDNTVATIAAEDFAR